MVDDVDLPKAQIKRIVQSKLPTDNKSFSINKEALLAFQESAKVFISYISTTANDICKESKRQTISADDVIKAVEELEFTELAPQLKEFLEAYRTWNKQRNQKRAEASKASKKRRAEAGKGEKGQGEGPSHAEGQQPQQQHEEQQEQEKQQEKDGDDAEEPAEEAPDVMED